MDAAQLMLASFDAALKHPWESLANALTGLDDEASVWQHPAYAHEPHDEGVGRPGTVLWFLNHLEHCHRHYAEILRRRPVKDHPETPPPGELPLSQILPRLHAANAELRAELAKLKADDMEQPCTARNNVAQWCFGVVRHIAWHSGQIMTVRRMYVQR